MTASASTMCAGAHREAPGAAVYPPPWYLDLVRARLRTAAGAGRAGTAAAPVGDDARLLALAQGVVGIGGLDALPEPTRRHVLGLDVAEVRAYLRGVESERRAGRIGPRGRRS